MKHASRIYPLLLIVGLASLSYYLESTTRIETPTVEPQEQKPTEWQMTEGTFDHFDASGQLIYKIQGQQVWQDNDLTRLKTVNVEKNGDLSRRSTLTANQATYHKERGEITFENNVIVELNDPNNPDVRYTIKTDKLLLNLNTQQLSSDVVVMLQSDQLSGQCTGFEYDQQENIVQMHNNVSFKLKQQEGGPIVLKTDALSANLTEQIITSKSLSFFTRDDTKIETLGFTFNNKTKQLHLNQKVKLQHAQPSI
jgi:LPS export ABC transporter protein LptC